MKLLLIEIDSITSVKAASEFSADKIERLGDSIVETDGLVRPLVLRKTGFEQYTVVEGHLEYHAAVFAQTNNPHITEVAAVVIEDDEVEAAQRQLDLLEDRTTVTTPTLKLVKTEKDILKNVNVLTFPEPTRTLEEVQQERNAKYITPVTTKHEPLTPEAATMMEEAEVTVEATAVEVTAITPTKPNNARLMSLLRSAAESGNYRQLQRALKDCRTAGILRPELRLNSKKAVLVEAAKGMLASQG